MSRKQEFRAQFVAALRSGNIPQSHGQLGRPDGSRCCLGVACDIAVEAGVLHRYIDFDVVVYSNSDDDSSSQVGSFLPSWTAFNLFTGELFANGEAGGYPLPDNLSCQDGNETLKYASLVWLNDYAKLTFSQIADIVEWSTIYDD